MDLPGERFQRLLKDIGNDSTDQRDVIDAAWHIIFVSNLDDAEYSIFITQNNPPYKIARSDDRAEVYLHNEFCKLDNSDFDYTFSRRNICNSFGYISQYVAVCAANIAGNCSNFIVCK